MGVVGEGSLFAVAEEEFSQRKTDEENDGEALLPSLHDYTGITLSRYEHGISDNRIHDNLDHRRKKLRGAIRRVCRVFRISE